MALQNHPAIGRAAALVDAAQGNWLQVGLWPNPRIGYSGQEINNEGRAGQQGGFVGQQIITADKLRLNREVAAWEVQRAQRELQAARLRVLTDVRIAYFETLIAQRRRELSADLVHISERGVTAAEALFKSEQVSQVDPLRARIEFDRAEIVHQNAINQHVEAWRRLSAAMGAPGLAQYGVGPRLHGELNADQLDLSYHEILQQLLSESPQMAAALAEVEAAEWAIARADAEAIPNVDLTVGSAYDNATGDPLASVTIELPIPLFDRNQGGVRRAQAEAAAARQAVDRLALDLQSRLASAFQRYASAKNQVRTYSKADGILAKAQRSLELVRAGYEAEELGALDLLTAQRTFFETNLAYLDSLRRMWVALMEIRGLMLRDSLES